MKAKGCMLILIGLFGGVFVYFFDMIMGKPLNIIGPKSLAALVLCAFLSIAGFHSLLRNYKRMVLNKKQLAGVWLMAIAFGLCYAYAVFTITNPKAAWEFMLRCSTPILIIGGLFIYAARDKKKE
jgi:hypothetical protein